LTLPSDAPQVLPADWLGVALMLLAFVLFAVDLKATNHGLPTIGGITVLVLGSLMLFDVIAPYSWILSATFVVVVVVAILTGVLFVVALSEVRAAKGRPVTTGLEGMIGEVGVVKRLVGTSFPGWVFVHGEWWRAIAAVAPEDARKQEHERVIGVGATVQVVGLRDGKVVIIPFEPVHSSIRPKSKEDLRR
jgi:membrane-bound serine protease (ClpP class)